MIKNSNCNLLCKKPWYDSVCKNAKSILQKKLVACKKHNFPTKMMHEYETSKKLYRAVLEKNKKLYINKIVETISVAKNPKDFWDAVNYCRKKSTFYNKNNIS